MEWENQELRPRQLSLAEMVALVAFASLALAGFQWLPPNLFAGFTGLASLGALGVLSALQSRRASLHVAWWILLAVYLLASAVAALRMDGYEH